MCSVQPDDTMSEDMQAIAHIGKIPVEEWVPFVVPVLALYIYGRRRERRRRAAVERLPEAGAALDEATVDFVVGRWSEGKHGGVSRAQLPLLYPPGPDGLTAEELAVRTHIDAGRVERLLEELEELGYVEVEEREGRDGPRAWLTFEGYDLLYETEAALLARSAPDQPLRGEESSSRPSV